MIQKLKTQWDTAKGYIDISDIAFAILRIVVLGGGIAWLIFTEVSQKITLDVSRILIYFIVYCIFIYLWLFTFPHKKRATYLFSLFFDLSFVSLLVKATGGFDSHFFNGFYLITALYSFYYGLASGVAVAAIATVLYAVSGGFDFDNFTGLIFLSEFRFYS